MPISASAFTLLAHRALAKRVAPHPPWFLLQSFCAKQGACYNSSSIYLPWSTCDFSSEPCQNFGNTYRSYCYSGFNMCLEPRDCIEASAKRSCPSNATLLTSLSTNNSCNVPSNLTVRFTLLQQEGWPVLRFGSYLLNSSRIGQELQLNNGVDTSSCVSADALAMSTYSAMAANLSWVRLQMRFVDNRDGRVVAECQPSYGIILPPSSVTPPAAPFPTVVLQRNSSGNMYENINLIDWLRGALNASTASAPWCDSIGLSQFLGAGSNALLRQWCRELPKKGAFCYIDVQPLYTSYSFYAYSYHSNAFGRAAANAIRFGSGYLLMTLDNVYVNLYLTQPGSVSFACRAWNGLLPTPNTPSSGSDNFGADILRVQYTVTCSYGYEACLTTRSCVPIGTPCRQSYNNCSMVRARGDIH